MSFVFTLNLAFTILAVTNFDATAQTSNELVKKINNYQKQDTTKLKLYLKLSSHYTERQADSALKYSLISKKLAEQLKYQKFHVEALEYLGRAQVGKGLYTEALATFKKQESLVTDYAQKAQTIRNQGNVYVELSKQKEAIDAYLRSLDIAYLSKHQLTIAITLSNIAYVYRQQGDYELAISHLIKASKIADEINNSPLSAGINIQLALIQYNRKVYPEAIKYATYANNIYSKLNNIQGQATSLTILGGAYSETNNLTKARAYIEEAYSLNTKLGDKRQIFSSANNLATINFEMNNYSEGLKLANVAINGLKQLNIVINLIGAYTNRGKIYISLKDFQKAENDIDSALNLCKKHKYKLQEKNAMEALALLKAAQGNHVEAFHMMVKSTKLNDSLLNETNSKQINELKTKYDTEKKQIQIDLLNEKTKLQELNIYSKNLELDRQKLTVNNQQLDLKNKDLLLLNKESDIQQKKLETAQQQQQIKSLHQQNTIQQLEIKQRNLGLGIALGILLLGGGFAYLIINRRKLKAKADLQSEIIKQQDIASKAVLDAEERERRRIAGDLHDGVGQMLSAALMNLNGLFSRLNLQNEVNLQAEQALALVNESYDEMRSISHQMMPNALIKSGLASAVKEFIGKLDKDKLKVTLETVGLNERLDEQTETVIYRVIQETVNNVVKHAEASKLDIQIIKDEEGISVTIEDNGKGFDKNKVDVKAGIGLSNIYSRVEFLKGTVDIDSTEGRGTLVAIHLASPNPSS
ncbi:MAG: tetratricopeptide repeat-containing sensor histidine kinase [Pedobacter sp.]